MIGASIAYHLTLRGATVTLLERNAIASGSTGRSVAICSPAYSNEVNVALAKVGFRAIRDFQRQVGFESGFVPRTQLMAVPRPFDVARLKEVEALHRHHDLPTEALGPDAVAEVFPELRTEDLAGALYLREGGFGDPHLVTQGLLRGAKDQGAQILTNTPVGAIEVAGGRVRGVRTPGSMIEAPLVVNAAGPWCNEVHALLGLSLPVRVWQRMIFVTSPHPSIPNDRPIFEDVVGRFYFRQELNGGFLLGLVEDRVPGDKDDVDLDWGFLEACLTAAVHRVPALEKVDVVGGWSGLVTYSPDHCPIIGSMGPEGYFAANAMSGYGFTISYAVGLAMAELILDGQARSVDISLLRPSRFAEGSPVRGGGLWLSDAAAP